MDTEDKETETEVCTTEYEDVCRTEYERVCQSINRQEGRTVYDNACRTVYKCQNVPRQNCQAVKTGTGVTNFG